MFTTLLSNNAVTWVEYEDVKRIRCIVHKKYLRRLCLVNIKYDVFTHYYDFFCYLSISKEQKLCFAYSM